MGGIVGYIMGGYKVDRGGGLLGLLEEQPSCSSLHNEKSKSSTRKMDYLGNRDQAGVRLSLSQRGTLRSTPGYTQRGTRGTPLGIPCGTPSGIPQGDPNFPPHDLPNSPPRSPQRSPSLPPPGPAPEMINAGSRPPVRSTWPGPLT